VDVKLLERLLAREEKDRKKSSSMPSFLAESLFRRADRAVEEAVWFEESG